MHQRPAGIDPGGALGISDGLLEAIAAKHCANKVDAIDAVRRYAVTIGRDAGDLMLNSTEQLRMQFRKQSLAHWS